MADPEHIPTHEELDEAGRVALGVAKPSGALSRIRIPNAQTRINLLDVLWVHPTSGAKFFVGGQSAAENLSLLKKHGIVRVVNCLGRDSKNYHEKVAGFEYKRFPIALWSEYLPVNDFGPHPSSQAALRYVNFFSSIFRWVESCLAAGHGVLVHCLAGAHRAGSTGIAWLMYIDGLSKAQAVAEAKRLRPIIDPIFHLGTLLDRYEKSLRIVGLLG